MEMFRYLEMKTLKKNIEEVKLVEPQLDYIEDEFTEQEVIDGMQTEMKPTKSFDVYGEIPIGHRQCTGWYLGQTKKDCN